MKSYDSDIFGQMPAPSKIEDLFSIVFHPPNKSFFNVWMWRGQADVKWPLHSAAYRRLLVGAEVPTDRQLESYEVRLLKSATHRGYRQLDGSLLSDFDLLARLQHHGGATRLLDMTRSVLVGLYFACNELPKQWGALFGFHSDHLGGGEGGPISEVYGDVIRRVEKLGHSQTWEPPNISARVAAQHSQFVFSSISDQKTGSIAVANQPGSLLTIAISPQMKKEFLHVLSGSFDIRGLTLFPDLDGFCDYNTPLYGQYDNERW